MGKKIAREIKKGDSIKIAGKECLVEEVEISDIGKQGTRKVRIVAKTSENDKIVIVKEDYTADNYKAMGKRFISEYYDHYKPFNSLKIIGLETQNLMPLSNGNQFHVRIDRLACDHEGNYYVCDYKTNNQLKAQEELDEDKQLAMYSIWIKQKYPDAKSVKLVWYFLAHDKEMISERGDEQLEKLKLETEELIREIEACNEFPTNISTLCDYCQYKQMCPAWKHEVELEQKSEEEFKEDIEKKIKEKGFVPEETRKRKLGRNELCHCGSGKKYKKCCLNRDIEKYGKAIKVDY